MTDRRGNGIERVLRSTFRDAGRRYEEFRRSGQFEEAREAYRSAKNASGLPTDDEGRAKIVCRRYAERRAALLDEEYRPACYEAGHPDCEGCAEDVREGRIETW
ncbi:DUF7091 family protein [Salinilacihabitans rarus]|uniref:DUF7091 family protein n=1 Tax=Salinilacihabitans rarus TaxID=2961596 RepID=UPI0020C89885|nr:hypothetical protein [Salinilacihabitans rarus]